MYKKQKTTELIAFKQRSNLYLHIVFFEFYAVQFNYLLIKF